MICVYFSWRTKYDAERRAPPGLPSKAFCKRALENDDNVGVFVKVLGQFLIWPVAGFGQHESGNFTASYDLRREVTGDESYCHSLGAMRVAKKCSPFLTLMQGTAA